MKVYISADIEGVAGISHWDEARKEHATYQEFRGEMTDEVVASGFNITGKDGIVVVTGLNKLEEETVRVSGATLTLFRKSIKGSLFGDCNPTYDIPKILSLYKSGDLKLDELITRTYTLDQVNEGYEDLQSGKNVRAVMVHEH